MLAYLEENLARVAQRERRGGGGGGDGNGEGEKEMARVDVKKGIEELMGELRI